MDYWVYIIECGDGTLYTGVSSDVDKRIARHNMGKGAKYTRGRLPVVEKYREKVGGKGEALKREIEIKRMTREEKCKMFN